MFLLIDVGNTNTKLCTYCPRERLNRVSFDWAFSNLKTITKIVYASVASNDEFARLLELASSADVAVIKIEVAEQHFGIRCAYAEYQHLGIDRWLAVLGAELIQPKTDIVIVDAGTAMTVDVLTSDKRHLGGWIIPGLTLLQQTMVAKAPGVFTSEDLQYQEFGTNTPSALYAGCLNALTGAIDRARALLQDRPQVDQRPNPMNVSTIVTGGDANVLVEHLDGDAIVEPHLVFHGLKRFI